MFGYKGGKSYIPGNQIRLLRNGDEFFPQLVRRIRNARHEIYLETFILEDDRVGRLLQKALVGAARRGVWISITADSYGSFFLPEAFIEALTDAGVVFQIFDPQPGWVKWRPKVFRRLHRKLAVIDGQYAFIGGINLSYEHVLVSSDKAKKDFAAEIQGPVVKNIRELCKSNVPVASNMRLGADFSRVHASEPVGETAISIVGRDNSRHRTEIEKAYLAGIRNARHKITIANAYFFPGYRLMRALRKAARRGVEVRLVLQGNPDIPFALKAARCLYQKLTTCKIKVYEYTERPLHAKVATIDDTWSTIGSSNLDPWSLSFNLEANIFVEDAAFNQALTAEIDQLIEQSRLIEQDWVQRKSGWFLLKGTLTYHLLRSLPNLIQWIPESKLRIRQIKARQKIGRTKGTKVRREDPQVDANSAHDSEKPVVHKPHNSASGA